MQIVVKGKNIEITDALRSYAEKKLHPMERHFDNIIEVQATLNVAKNPSVERNNVVELTALVNGAVLRVEESADNMYAALDLAAERMDRQVRKYKERIQDKPDIRLVEALEPEEEGEAREGVEDSEISADTAIVKRKSFILKPMFPEDDVIKMEELNHSFFVFRDAESEGISVIYKRNDGNYGLIETR